MHTTTGEHMTQEALKLALEALVAVHIEGDVECVVTPNGTIYLRPAITAIKEALAQPEQIDPNQWAFDNGLEST
jgi:hypothetical protein